MEYYYNKQLFIILYFFLLIKYDNNIFCRTVSKILLNFLRYNTLYVRNNTIFQFLLVQYIS